GSKDTARFGPGEAERAAALVAAIHAAGRTAMVQPYLDAVDDDGETALMYFAGAFSHAVRKGPLLRAGAEPAAGLHAPEEVRAREPSAAQRALADAALAVVHERFGVLPYARVDLVPGPGGPRLLELELTEPSLFLGSAPGAAGRLARALRREMARGA